MTKLGWVKHIFPHFFKCKFSFNQYSLLFPALVRDHRQISFLILTLSWRRPIPYRNQSTDLRSKSMDWFLYDIGLRHERVNQVIFWWFQEGPNLLILLNSLNISRKIWRQFFRSLNKSFTQASKFVFFSISFPFHWKFAVMEIHILRT